LAGKHSKVSNRAVFLDRDGTIIEEKGYLSDPDKVILELNTIPALKLLKENGFRLFVTTNQSGIARKYFQEGQLFEIHGKLKTLLSLNRIDLDGIFYCPHGPEDDCNCRKPKIGMALGAQRKFNIDLKSSYSIGDKLTDIQFAKNFGGKGVLVLTGFGKQENLKLKEKDNTINPDFVANDIYEAAKWVVQDAKGK
jgi:D-glycero-D-manno-heptose 1,7-bisphosphate phosphatase